MSAGSVSLQSSAPRNFSPLNARVKWILILLLVGWCVLRVCLAPGDGAISGGFEHDAAYIGIVAEQVRDGHGFVNPAHWLLFLNPPRLPIPFHNANPGYPALIAAVSGALGVDVVRAGLSISAACNALLMLGVFLMVRHYVTGWRVPAFCAALLGFYPVNWADSFAMVPDALSTSLMVLAIALVLGNRSWNWLAAGAVLGTAWLARSSASTAVLPIVWFLFRRNSMRDAVRSWAFFGAAFTIVISPWLVHTYQVWGSPFRSDASFYLFQEYYARSLGGDVDRFWRSLSPPPGIHISDLGSFLPFYLANLPKMLWIVFRGVRGWTKINALITLGLAIIAARHTWKWWRTPELQSGALLMALTVGVLAIRAQSAEIRYLGPALVLFVIWLAIPWFGNVDPAAVPAAARYPRAAAAAAALGALVVIVPQDVGIWRFETGLWEPNLAYRNACRRVAAGIAGDERVMIPKPYFYTFFTGHSSVAPPAVDKAGLLAFMSRYSVKYVALPADKLDYYYPDFRTFEPELRPAGDAGFLRVFKRTE